MDAWYLDSFPVTMFGAARVCFSQRHGEQSPHGVGQWLLEFVFLMGYRFDILGHKLNRDNPDMIYIRDLIALRNSIKDELYDSSFKDEVGLGKLPQNVWAKIFRHDQGQSLTVAFIDRRESKDAMSLTVDASRLDVGCMSKAMLHTLDGRQTELKIDVRADGVLVMEIPGRKDDPAAVIIQ